MSASFPERLSRFTPDGTGLDRDALLFAAGRASARPSRLWAALAGTLAASQLLTLALLWPRTLPIPTSTVETVPTERGEPGPPVARQRTSFWEVRERAISSDGWTQVDAEDVDLAPSGPPLHAFGPLPAELMN